MKKIVLIVLMIFTFSFSLVSALAAESFASHTVYFDTQNGEYTHAYVNEFENVLANRNPASLLFIGDSTSNEDTDWVYLTSQYLVDQINDYSINYRFFDDTTKSYNRIDYLQTGDAGDAYATLDGSYGTKIQTINSSALAITGDIDIAVKIAADDYTSSAGKTLVNKMGASDGIRGYQFNLTGTTPTPRFLFSPDGTTVVDVFSTAAATVENGQAIWFRVTLDVDNGSAGNDVKFYTSSDGSTWAQLGSTITTAGVTSINENSQPISFGSRDGYQNLWAGKFYEAVIKDGIGAAGRVVASPDLGNIRTGTSFEDVEGNIYNIFGGIEVGYGAPELTILNASVSGVGTYYFTDEAVFDHVVTLNPEMTFVSLGHNEGLFLDIRIAYNTLLSNIKNKITDTNFVLVTQNPKVSPIGADNIAAHEIRQQQIGVIASENGYGYIDAYEALSANTAVYVMADGVHPTAEGSIVWADEAEKFLQGAFSTGVSTYRIEVEDATVANLPDDPIKTGYIFDGWYTNEAVTQEYNSQSAVVTQDITLYAKWIVDGTAGTPGTITPDGDTLEFLGIAWYLWIIGGAVIYLASSKKARKSLGFKK